MLVMYITQTQRHQLEKKGKMLIFFPIAEIDFHVVYKV